jgi:hypothetical protein
MCAEQTRIMQRETETEYSRARIVYTTKYENLFDETVWVELQKRIEK